MKCKARRKAPRGIVVIFSCSSVLVMEAKYTKEIIEYKTGKGTVKSFSEHGIIAIIGSDMMTDRTVSFWFQIQPDWILVPKDLLRQYFLRSFVR